MEGDGGESGVGAGVLSVREGCTNKHVEVWDFLFAY